MLNFRAIAPGSWHVDQPLELMKFPAGESHLKLSENDEIYTPEYVQWTVDPETLNDDLVALGMYADYARQRGVSPRLFAPYFPAARADRGSPFGAKVYADLINAMEFDEVTILDPHSPVIVQLIDNVRVLDATHVLTRSIFGRSDFVDNSWAGVIAPDAGAVDRTWRVAERLGLPMFQAEKHRDFATGKLTGFSCEKLPDEGRLLVVDDLCDGGGSFRGLIEASGLPRHRAALWVTHGVFSGRANQLKDIFGAVYTTDSHTGARRADVGAKVFNVGPYYTYGPFVPLANFGVTENDARVEPLALF